MSLLEESGYSYSGIIDIKQEGKLFELLLEADAKYREKRDALDKQEKLVDTLTSELNHTVGVISTIHDILTKEGFGECGKITYCKGNENIVITRTSAGIQYSSYIRCDMSNETKS